MKTTHPKNTPFTGILVLATSMALLSSASAEDEIATSPYQMMYFTDAVASRGISKGRFAEAARITEKRSGISGSDYRTQTNRCVAYIKSKNLQNAAAACAIAVDALITKKTAATSSGRKSKAARFDVDRDLSIALTNQGVLYALGGKSEQARMMFEEAILMDPNRHQASSNLRRLDSENL